MDICINAHGQNETHCQIDGGQTAWQIDSMYSNKHVKNKYYHAVGTPGLGYPFLLYLGKSLVVILDYVQTAGPLWSGVLFLSTTAPDLNLGKVRE